MTELAVRLFVEFAMPERHALRAGGFGKERNGGCYDKEALTSHILLPCLDCHPETSASPDGPPSVLAMHWAMPPKDRGAPGVIQNSSHAKPRKARKAAKLASSKPVKGSRASRRRRPIAPCIERAVEQAR